MNEAIRYGSLGRVVEEVMAIALILCQNGEAGPCVDATPKSSKSAEAAEARLRRATASLLRMADGKPRR